MRYPGDHETRTWLRRQWWMVRVTALMVVGLTSIIGIAVAGQDHVNATPRRVGAHTLLVQEDGHGTNPAVTTPIDTQADGSSLLVLVAGYASNSAAPTDNYSNTWTQLDKSVFYDGYQKRFDVKAYVSQAAKGGRRHTVSMVKSGNANGEITIPFVEIQNAGLLQDFVHNYPAPGTATHYSNKVVRAMGRLISDEDKTTLHAYSGDVTTTGPATLVAIWWGDANILDMSAVPDGAFTVIDSFLHLPPDSGVQCVVAYRQVAAAGTYHVTWTTHPAQRAILWLFAFQGIP